MRVSWQEKARKLGFKKGRACTVLGMGKLGYEFRSLLRSRCPPAQASKPAPPYAMQSGAQEAQPPGAQQAAAYLERRRERGGVIGGRGGAQHA